MHFTTISFLIAFNLKDSQCRYCTVLEEDWLGKEKVKQITNFLDQVLLNRKCHEYFTNSSRQQQRELFFYGYMPSYIYNLEELALTSLIPHYDN